MPLSLPVGQQQEQVSLTCYAPAHALAGAKVQTSQPGSGAGRKCLLLSLPSDTKGSDSAVALSQSLSRQPGPRCLLHPRNTIARGINHDDSCLHWEVPLAVAVLCAWACLLWRTGNISFWFGFGFFHSALALKTVNLQRKKCVDSATVAKSLHQIVWYSIYTFKVLPHYAHYGTVCMERLRFCMTG